MTRFVAGGYWERTKRKINKFINIAEKLAIFYLYYKYEQKKQTNKQKEFIILTLKKYNFYCYFVFCMILINKKKNCRSSGET